ncbi:M20/M25/M40 family metallo-hydrolase [Persicitalea sp.]|uniref:M20/M25/M40 family metallo-hydrolase n=1 Tax=Persicitalea sp. TaxID=3100273 RepID=UPI003592F997
MTPNLAKVAFFDIGGTLGNVRVVSENGFAEDLAEPIFERTWFDGFSSPVFFLESQRLRLDIFPGIVETLRELQTQNIRLGVVSKIGDFAPSSVDEMLRDAGVFTFFEKQLLHYVGGDTPKNKREFKKALKKANLKNGDNAVYAGEDPNERAQAELAGMRVAGRPEDALAVLLARHVLYAKISIPAEQQANEWHQVLLDHQVEPLYVTDDNGKTVYAIVQQEQMDILRSHPFQFSVQRLGELDAPYTTELYLLRDVPSPPDSSDQATEKYAPGFESGETQSWILEKTRETGVDVLFVALPIGNTIENLSHFTGSSASHRHGHTLKLTPPSTSLLQPIGFGPNAWSPDWLVADSASGLLAETSAQISTSEIETLKSEITEAQFTEYIERYSVEIPSRHIQHAGNRLAVEKLVEDLSAILGSEFVSTDRFVHEGRILSNVTGKIPGTTLEIIVLSAHLDSTGAGDEHFRPTTDPAPGADDDASGMAAVLLAAKAIRKLTETAGQPSRTIHFVLFNAEEHGLVGSRFYANKQRAAHEPIIAVYQLDMIGFDQVPPSQFEIHFGFAPRIEIQERSRLLANLIRRITPQVAPALPNPEVFPAHSSQADPADRRSDHASFQMVGYAACVISEDFFRGSDNGSGESDGNPHYHQPTDKIEELNVGYAVNIARVITATIWMNANKEITTLTNTFKNSNHSKLTMPKNFDSRNFSFNRIESGSALRDSAANLVSSIIAEATVNKMTGMPRSFGSAGSELKTPLSLLQRAIKEVQGQLTGFSAEEPADFVPDPLILETSAGTRVVNLHQQYLGVPIFQMSRNVQFTAFGEAPVSEGDSIPHPSGFDITPVTDLLKAVVLSIENLQSVIQEPDHDPFMLPPDPDAFGVVNEMQIEPSEPVEIKLDGYIPKVVYAFADPTRHTLIGWLKASDDSDETPQIGPLGSFIPVNLTIFYQGFDTRLGWEMLITLAGQTDQYRIIWPADNPAALEPLYRQQTARSVRATGFIYPFSPRPGGTPAPVSTKFPLELGLYPVDRQLSKPSADPLFPRDWCDGEDAIGNATFAVKGNTIATFRGTRNGDIVNFQPNDPFGDDQKVLNIFYFCNYMHDFFYLLGFDEANGNFQRINFTVQGNPSDPVKAKAHPGVVTGTANMLTPADGISPIMNMGLVAGNRHTAFDADVVFHEFCHGVTNRLVGGRFNTSALEQLQSGGMGEGWGDYFALTIQNFDKDVQTERRVTGDWVTSRKAGIRAFPYGPRSASHEPDASRRFPDSFGSIGTGRYSQVHNIGEIWCATLMHVNRMIGIRMGDYKRGHQIGWQIVVDGLKLTRGNPSFLDARNAILKALDDLKTANKLTTFDHKNALTGAWIAFAEFGMGTNAFCPNASLQDIQENFDLPVDLQVSA